MLLPLFSHGQKYFQTTWETIGGWNAFVSKPANYASQSPKRYPVFIFIPGNGEVASDADVDSVDLKRYGPHNFINGGTMPAILHPTTGDTLEAIIISLQPSGQWPSQSTIASRIDSIISHTTNRWRVDSFRVTLSGLSAGGWAAANYITGTTRQGQRITANVLMHHPITDNGATDALKHGNMATYARNGGKIWGFEDSTGDYRKMNITRDSMNRAVANSYRYTGRPTVTGGHCCWNTWYDPAFTQDFSGTNMNVYQWALTQARAGAYQYWGTPATLQANAGNDTAYIYDQGGVAQTFTLSGSAENATSPSYSWAALSGNPASVTITSPTSASTTVTGANVPGYYGYELTVTEGEASDKDTVYLQLRDLMKRGLRPCRVGAKQRFYFGNELIPGRVTTTDIYAQYITRDNLLPNVQGGDTLVIVKNPNDDTGYWKWIFIGDISGSPGCPIVITGDTATRTIVSSSPGGVRGWYIGNGDSATVAYVKFDGGAWYNRTGVRFGLGADNGQYPYDSSDTPIYTLNAGVVLNLGHHVEFTGWAFNNSTYMFQVKKNSDSTNPFSIYDNYRFTGIKIHHNYGYKLGSEGMYLGHTDWNGTSQAGNKGRTLMMDSLEVAFNIVHKAGKDGLQIAGQRTNALIHDNLVYQSGYRNASSHRWSIFIGGNATGKMYNNTIVNARGAAGTLGMGIVEFYNNIIDSIGEGGNTEPAIYANKSTWTGNTDSLKFRVYNNIIKGVLKTGNNSFVQVDNLAGLMGKGTISNNIFAHHTKTLISQMVTTNAADTVTGNIIVADINIDTSFLGKMDSYRMHQILRNTAPGTPISFYDLPPLVQPQRGFRMKGKRFKFKIS